MKVLMTVFNRFTWAIEMCKKFEQAGLEIIIIDNASTYPPCVEWLNTCGHKVERMDQNYGPWVFLSYPYAQMQWINKTADQRALFMKYPDRFFILADSDFDLTGVPNDFPDHLMKGLISAKRGEWKCGLSYEINDLPSDSVPKQVYEYEKRYWVTKNHAGYFESQVDIGVTLYDREKQGEWFHAIRSDRPYTCRHLDWYHAREGWREEDQFFVDQTPGYYGWARKYYEEEILKLPPR